MTPDEHYLAAERYLAEAASDGAGVPRGLFNAAMAQAHAILSLRHPSDIGSGVNYSPGPGGDVGDGTTLPFDPHDGR